MMMMKMKKMKKMKKKGSHHKERKAKTQSPKARLTKIWRESMKATRSREEEDDLDDRDDDAEEKKKEDQNQSASTCLFSFIALPISSIALLILLPLQKAGYCTYTE